MIDPSALDHTRHQSRRHQHTIGDYDDVIDAILPGDVLRMKSGYLRTVVSVQRHAEDDRLHSVTVPKLRTSRYPSATTILDRSMLAQGLESIAGRVELCAQPLMCRVATAEATASRKGPGGPRSWDFVTQRETVGRIY